MVGILAATVEDAFIVLVLLSVIFFFQSSFLRLLVFTVLFFVVMQLSVEKFHLINFLISRYELFFFNKLLILHLQVNLFLNFLKYSCDILAEDKFSTVELDKIHIQLQVGKIWQG